MDACEIRRACNALALDGTAPATQAIRDELNRIRSEFGRETAGAAGMYVTGTPRMSAAMVGANVAMIAAERGGENFGVGGNNDATGGYANRKTNTISKDIQQVAQEIGRMIELASTPPWLPTT